MSDLQEIIRQNVADVQGRIADAAREAGRSPESVRLVAVTKYVDAEQTRAVIRAGCQLLGESRPQHLVPKAEKLADEPVHWHMIGQLQRNKIRRVLPVIAMLESIDSLRLLDAVNRISGELDQTTNGLLEINISGDATKSGFLPEDMDQVIEQLDAYPHVEIRGLMGMASLTGGPAVARRNFATLREFRDHLTAAWSGRVSLTELSMGMSGDFEQAIHEGATLVRIGSALFEGT
ncbi:MAG: YggS family pyridoxal phosphate-dependent enzyme [Planctomycetia bacterium]|jgi:pyridoxal phosphate enzyme (YggS family)